jgi:hypothetical protein
VRLKGRATGLWLAPLVAVAAAAAVLWWRFAGPRTVALAPGWPARVVVVAGNGIDNARDGTAAEAGFSNPFGVAGAADGVIYVSDSHRIRRVSPDGHVITIAGGDAGFADGIGDAARFSTPSGLALDVNGTLYVADTGNNAIRRVTPDGRVSTVAGRREAGYRDGAASEARFNGPVGIALHPSGRLIVADTYNDRIRAIDPDGSVGTVAGSDAPGAVDGLATEARFHTPTGVAVDSSGNIYVADTGNGAVRIIDAAALVTTPDWSRVTGLSRPLGIAVTATRDVYVTDEGGSILEVAAEGPTRTLAGSTPGFRDGFGGDAQFRRPAGLAIADAGRLIVADTGNGLIRLVAAPARLELRPPVSPRVNPQFDANAFDFQPLLWPVFPFEGPHEIAGTLGEARGGDAERFHAGIDVRIDDGVLVHAVRDGVVSSPVASGAFDSLNEHLRIGPLNYVHIRAGRTRGNEVLDTDRFVPTYEDGKLAGIRVKRGARFAAGDVIGSVNAFHHVHVNVGWPGEEYNPLRFRLVHFRDTLPPTIARGGVRLHDEHGQPLTRRIRGRVAVSGRVQIVVDAWDQVNGNRSSRRLGVYDLGYQVLNRDGSPAAGFESARHTMRFDRLAATSEAARLVYAPGSGIPFYRGGRTRFLYIVSNTLRDGVAAPDYWDTTLLAPGDYIVRAWVADIHGNTATANRDLPVTILKGGGPTPAWRPARFARRRVRVQEHGRNPSPDGTLEHAEMRFGDGAIMINVVSGNPGLWGDLTTRGERAARRSRCALRARQRRRRRDRAAAGHHAIWGA